MSAEVFDWLAEGMEKATNLDRLQARGALRLALKEAGLDPDQLTRSYAAGVIDRVLPERLVAMGVEDVASVCEALSRGLATLDAGADESHGAESLFARLRAE